MKKKVSNKLRRHQHALPIISNAMVGSMGRVVGYSTVGLLGLVLLTMLCPMVGTNANAETLTASLPTITTAHLYSSISVSTSNNLDINLIPKSTGSVEVGTTNITVATNNTTGYSIYLSTANGSNKLEQIKNVGASGYTGDSNTDYAINPLSGEVTKAAYLGNQANYNTWGYALTNTPANDSTIYKGLTNPTGEAISSTNTTSSRDTYNLNVAVAVDTTLPAGDYRNGLVVSAIANPIQVSGFNKIMYMQEMTPAVCNEVEIGTASELVDKRDNTIYQVARLADGHCWMTQNLALDLSTEIALTPEDSDVTENWVPKTSTEYEIPLPNDKSTDNTRSWDLGRIILTNPTGSTLCPGQTPPNNGQSYPSNDQSNSAFTGQSIADTCPEYYKDVSSGWVADSNPELYSAMSSINSNSYDPHYLIGNYYQWNTAAAGTGFTVDGANITGTAATNAEGAGLTNVSGSICPKGWQLPKAGRNSSATETIFGVGPGRSYDIDGSFYHLIKAYGYNSGWDIGGGDGYMSINNTDRTANLSGSPIYFVRSGLVYPLYGSLRSAGYNGYGWSSTVFSGSSSDSYYLGFDTANVFPSHSTNRYVGFSVRCLAR